MFELVADSRGEAWEAACKAVLPEIEIQLCKGNWEAAHAIIDRMQSICGQAEQVTDVLELPLASVLSGRLANQLERSFGAITVGDLNKVPWGRIAASDNIGPAAQNEILRAWRALGFTQKRI